MFLFIFRTAKTPDFSRADTAAQENKSHIKARPSFFFATKHFETG